MAGRIRQGSCPHEFTIKWGRQALIKLSVSVSHTHKTNKQTKTCGWNTGTDAMEERSTGLEESMREYFDLIREFRNSIPEEELFKMWFE